MDADSLRSRGFSKDLRGSFKTLITLKIMNNTEFFYYLVQLQKVINMHQTK